MVKLVLSFTVKAGHQKNSKVLLKHIHVSNTLELYIFN